jgi:hypothetical protein
MESYQALETVSSESSPAHRGNDRMGGCNTGNEEPGPLRTDSKAFGRKACTEFPDGILEATRRLKTIGLTQVGHRMMKGCDFSSLCAILFDSVTIANTSERSRPSGPVHFLRLPHKHYMPLSLLHLACDFRVSLACDAQQSTFTFHESPPLVWS